jgi:outer membrane protein TolC
MPNYLVHTYSHHRSHQANDSSNTPHAKNLTMRHICISICIGLLASCSFAPKYSTPSLGDEGNNKWRDNPWVEAHPSDSMDKGQWWLMFKDEDLNELEKRLDKNSPSLAIALAKYDQANAYLKQAQSQYLPSVDLNESTTQNRQSHNRPLRGSNQPDYYNAYTGFLGVNYELDFWGRVRGLVSAAKAQSQASAADLQTEKLSLQSKLAQIYFQLRGNDKQSNALAQSIKAYERAYLLIKNRYEVGIASGIDLSRAQAQLNTAKAEASELNIQRALFEHAIAVLTGQPPQSFQISVHTAINNATQFTDSASEKVEHSSSVNDQQMIAYLDYLGISNPPQLPAGLPSTLLERRPDVAAAERKTLAANERIGVAKAAFFPTFSIGASAGYQNTGGPAWMSEPNSFWSIGPAASFNLFDNGLRQAQLSIAKSSFDQAGAEYRLVVLSAYQQVQDAMAKLNEYTTEIQARSLAAYTSNHAMQLSTSRYRDGAVNYLEVITAQTAALQSQRALIELDTNRLIASIDLIKALGGGWNKDDLEQVLN